MKLDEPEQLDELLQEQNSYSLDFKALVLRLYHENGGDVAAVSTLTKVPVRTIYSWVESWNMSAQKKKA